MYTDRKQSALPPLPDALPPAPTVSEPSIMAPTPVLTEPAVGMPPLRLRSLRCGCYLLNYTPKQALLTTFDGTLRVECHSNGRTASGDLYQRRVFFLPIGGPLPQPPRPVLGPAPNPASGIPILARSRYRYYLRVTQLLENFTLGSSFTLGLQMYKFTAPNTWAQENGDFSALMTWVPAPAGFPSPGDYLEGDVKNAAGIVVGRLTMGWVSQYLRKATVEVDCVTGSEAPLQNGAGLDWRNVFDKVGWDITVDVSDPNVAEPSGQGWSDAELHQAMLARRDASNLDTEWRYHVLAVKILDATPRGIMYDAGGTDSNNVPREGIGISSHWVIPNASPWGTVKGLRFGTAAAPYFRTAIHEVGHAMGLFHNTADNGFMNTTDVIAAACPTTFPDCIKWGFAPDDEKRLRHYPDAFVRPGATTFGGASTVTPPITPTDIEAEAFGLTLQISALLEVVPIGAPVRINLKLTNETETPVIAPNSISMKSGMVMGTVIDPSGTVRSFSPVVRCVEEMPLQALAPGASLTDSITLLRGAEGALFPMPGAYRIQVMVHWDAYGVESAVVGETAVMVTAAFDAQHAEAALKVLSTPDILLTLAIGGDHLTDGIEAVHTALDNPVLRPHFSYIEAKRVAKRFGGRKADLDKATQLITKETVMSPAEKVKADTFVKAAAPKTGR